MSLRGRYFIDRVKRVVSGSLRLPVPPYGDPFYWDAAYKSFGPQDSFEWGSVSLEDILKYKYHQLDLRNVEKQNGGSSERMDGEISTTLQETLGFQYPIIPNSNKTNGDGDIDNDESIHIRNQKKKQQQSEKEEEPMLILGCGNSRLGEELLQEGFVGPIVQTDVSRRVIESMSQRCNQYVDDQKMSFVEDDATELSAFRNNMFHGCFDKGLIDAIYCADEYTQCASVLNSVNRVLIPGGVFIFLSFTRPEFLLPNVVQTELYRTKRPIWDNVEVQELSSIMLYKFQKAASQNGSKKLTQSSKMKKRRRRNH